MQINILVNFKHLFNKQYFPSNAYKMLNFKRANINVRKLNLKSTRKY